MGHIDVCNALIRAHENRASTYRELVELYEKIYAVSGLTPEAILEMFRMGYTLEAPDNDEYLWQKVERLATDD